MIFGYADLYPPDDIELALPDVGTARRFFDRHSSDIAKELDQIAERINADVRSRNAVVLGTAHLALRHGQFSQDLHAYHNENHVLELVKNRLIRLLDGIGKPLPTVDISALLIFSACHDLRQRENPTLRPHLTNTGSVSTGSTSTDSTNIHNPIGHNEAASIAETFRILDACGFDRQHERQQYIALELMIAGSTFHSQPTLITHAHAPATPDFLAVGALARNLAHLLDQDAPGWQKNPETQRGERLAQWAADLDTANVGEPYVQLCEAALRLCCEHEMRAGRALNSPASALPCLHFLGENQCRYLFELHQFCSYAGEQAFGSQKLTNGRCVRETTAIMNQHFACHPPATGHAVLDVFAKLTGARWGSTTHGTMAG